MAISLASIHGRTMTVIGSLHFAAAKAKGVFLIAAQVVLRLILTGAPFLAAAGGLYWWLLTDHDINYYLNARPAQFWWASVSIATLLAVLTSLVLRCVVDW